MSKLLIDESEFIENLGDILKQFVKRNMPQSIIIGSVIQCTKDLFKGSELKWISVEERMPNEMQYVLIKDDLKEFHVAQSLTMHSKLKWILTKGDGLLQYEDVTHWMPLDFLEGIK
jgi:hypothetical protein